MVRRRRVRVVLFGALALLAALLPAGLAVGTHDQTSGSSVIQLELGQNDRVTWLGHTQGITSRRNNCTSVQLGNQFEILTVTPAGGQLGFVKDGFGVQSAEDGSGDPCGRVETGESLTIALGTELEGYLISAIDLDVELKFNAAVTVELFNGTSPVDSFSFAGTDSDDGPDSGPEDNYRLMYEEAGNLFDTIVLTPTAGSFSLEGGADGTLNGGLATNNFSQFRVIQTFDGQITCDDEESIEEDGVSTSGVVTMHSEDPDGPEGSDDWTTENCDLKPFFEDVEDDALAFVPVLAGTTARYTVEVTVEDQLVTVDPETGQVTSLVAVYNANGDLSFPPGAEDPLPACEGQPLLDQSNLEAYNSFWTQPDTELLPGTETACWYRASVDPTSAGFGTESWGIYFEDDPGFNFR